MVRSFPHELELESSGSCVESMKMGKDHGCLISQATTDVEEKSPTRVADFDQGVGDSRHQSYVITGENRSIRRQLSLPNPPPPSMQLSSFGAKEPSTRRLRRKKLQAKFQALPTLDETSECNAYVGKSSSTAIGTPWKCRRQLQHQEQIDDLLVQAGELAATGNETEALQLYSTAIHMGFQLTEKLNKALEESKLHQPIHEREVMQYSIRKDIFHAHLIIAKTLTICTVLYEMVGQYDQAIESSQLARNAYKQCNSIQRMNSSADESNPQNVDLEELLSQNLCTQTRLVTARNSYPSRQQCLTEILQLRHKTITAPTSTDCDALQIRVRTLAQNLRQLELQSLGDDHPQIAETLRLLSVLAQEQGLTEEALELAKQATEINVVALGTRHPRTGHNYLRTARIYNSQRLWSQALNYFDKAADVFRDLDKRVYASILNDIAVIHVARCNYEAALMLLWEALELYNDNNGEHNLGRTDAVQVWRNIAECQFNLRDYEQSKMALISALELQRSGRKFHDAAVGLSLQAFDSSVSLIDDESIADTLRRLGKAYAAVGEYSKSLSVYDEALQMHRITVATATLRQDPLSFVATKQDQLAHTLYCIADVNCSLGKFDSALQKYNESLQLRLATDNQRQGRQNSVHCAMCLVGMGNCRMKTEEYVDSYELYDGALTHCGKEGLPEAHPIVSMILQKKTRAMDSMSPQQNKESELGQLEKRLELQTAEGKSDDAIITINQLLTIRLNTIKQIRATRDETIDELNPVIKLYHSLGFLLAEIGDEDNAQIAHQEGMRLFRANKKPSKKM